MPSKLMTGALIGTAGFLLATNPVVVEAAGQITSAQIKNNTIKSKDIKDNQIKSADVKDASLTGVDISDGTVGAADLAAGAQARLAVQNALGDMASASTDANLGDVVLTTGGVAGRNQLVMVEVSLQLDHDAAIGAGCSASWKLTRDASATVLATWSQELYAGAAAEEDNTYFPLITTQPSGSTSTYHILGTNSCSQTLFTDQDVLTAEAYPLSGAGTPPARGTAPRPSVAGHDR